MERNSDSEEDKSRLSSACSSFFPGGITTTLTIVIFIIFYISHPNCNVMVCILIIAVFVVIVDDLPSSLDKM